MKIPSLLSDGRVHISCEIFPPKEFSGLDQAVKVASDIATLKPSFISVTYGAGGNTAAHTLEIARAVKERGVTPLYHLTCATATMEQIKERLDELDAAGIENVLALRGDIPAGMDFPDPRHYRFASELVGQIKSRGGFAIGAACYPEGHPESPSKDHDLDFLRRKVDSGADFLTTQMFFDNNILYNFLYRALQKGIRVPVLPGIMPVVNAGQIKKITALSGASLPPRFAAILDRFSENPKAMRQAGIAFATEQIIDLIANGVNNIHIYTMNRPQIAAAIFQNLSDILRE